MEGQKAMRDELEREAQLKRDIARTDLQSQMDLVRTQMIS